MVQTVVWHPTAGGYLHRSHDPGSEGVGGKGRHGAASAAVGGEGLSRSAGTEGVRLDLAVPLYLPAGDIAGASGVSTSRFGQTDFRDWRI
jgi:hypothetical protein